MIKATLPILFVAACATSPSPSASGEIVIADVPASPATTAETGVAMWSVRQVGTTYVTRALDASGSPLRELRVDVTDDVVVRDARGGLIDIDAQGNIVANTLPQDKLSLQLYVDAHIDLDAYRSNAAKGLGTESLNADCALWILGIAGSAIGAGAGCFVCAAGLVSFVGAAALDC